jgi:hypothetical protein
MFNWQQCKATYQKCIFFTFLELRTDDRRIIHRGPLDMPMERPHTDPLCDSRRFPPSVELEHLRRSTQATDNRRILVPSADTNGFHATGK